MIYVLRLTSKMIYYSNPRAILISGTQRVSRTSCVLFDLYYAKGVSLNIRVPKCVLSSDDYGTLLLVTEGLGDVWHRVWLPIVVAGDCDAQIQIEVIYDINFSTESKVSIGNVTLLDKNCVGSFSPFR